MSDQDAFERILASLHDAMLDDAYSLTTFTLIEEACGTTGNGLLIEAGPADNIQLLFGQGYAQGQTYPEWMREYGEYYYPIDESVPRVRQLPDSRVVHIPELYTAEELKTSPTYNEFFYRSGCQNGLNVHLVGPEGSHITWALANPVTPRGWEAPQLALITGLLPHLRQFVRVRQALVKAEASGASTTALLDNTRLGVIHLDRRGQIIEANDRARGILRRGDGVMDRAGFLQARFPTDHVRLERLVAGALPTSGAPAVSGSMTLRRSAVMMPFVVHVTPVEARQSDYGARQVAALVLLAEPGRQSRINSSLVAETLGLTLAESQIAIGLAQGKTVHEIAEANGRSEHTLYWHLQQIYHKLSISRQTDLVRLVLSITEFA